MNVTYIKKIFFLAVFSALSISVFAGTNESKIYLKINKSIDIFGKVYQEVASNYVENIDPEKLMHAGIDGMLEALDPYTQFIDESEADEVELITTGRYGGIGISVGLRDGYITILSLMEGYSAQRQGLLPGDKILEIDGKNIIGAKSDEVRRLTRGEPFTEIKIKIEREDEKEPMEFICMREEIQLKSITYADFHTPGIAYIRLERFTRQTGAELRIAIQDLRGKGTITGIILDLRENPGGLLDAAVETAEQFLPKNSLIVSTKGKDGITTMNNRDYRSLKEPMLADVPMVIIVNRNSASASEIVAGALQDYDRGILLGTRTYGKGLVQTIVPLPYNTQMKITTAKYYTPSGRCIQEIDYSKEGSNGVFLATPESLRQDFFTTHHRKVKSAGGIAPDTLVENKEPSSLYKSLMQKSFLHKYASAFVAANKEMPLELNDETLFSDFRKFVSDKNFSYEEESEIKLNALDTLVKKSNFSATLHQKINEMKEQIGKEKDSSYERNKKEILRTLKMEIVSRYRGEKGRIEISLLDDVQVQTALHILQNVSLYQTLLKNAPPAEMQKTNMEK
jgi:carboxyl-terminal processing protease